MRIRWISVAVWAITGITSNAIWAQVPDDYAGAQGQTVSVSAAYFESVMRRLDALESSVAADPKAEEGWQDVSDQKWKIKIGGRDQMDYINWAASEIAGTENYFEFRRLRLNATGVGYGVYDFMLQFDLESDEIPGPTFDADIGVGMKDVWIGIAEVPVLGHVRFGHFYPPFSLEQLTSDNYTTFMERSIPTDGVFSPGREVGVSAENHSSDENVTWGYGVFFDSINGRFKERIDDNQGVRVVGRVTWTPYYDEPSEGRYMVHTGFAAFYTDDQDDVVRFGSRPEIHEGPLLIDTGNLAANDYATLGAEFAIVWGSVSLQSEFIYTSVNTAAGDVDLYGAYAFASYFLTGEHRPYNRKHGSFARPEPYSNFWIVPGSVGPGAWEVAARWSYLDFTKIGQGQLNDLTVGINWYWHPHSRMMFEWIHPWTSGTNVGDTESGLLGLRVQFDF